MKKNLYVMPQAEVIQMQPVNCIMDVLTTSTGGAQDYNDSDWTDFIS